MSSSKSASRRRRKPEEHENHERWLVSYADFITLLFAFFVVMYATSNQNIEKEKKFEEAIRAEFKMGGLGQGKQIGPNSGAGQSENSFVEQPIPQTRKENLQGEIQNSLRKKITEEFTTEEVKRIIIRADSQGVRIILSADEVFLPKSDKLRSDNLKFINRVVSTVKDSIFPIVIESHSADSEIDNWDLSTQRSSQFVRFLIKVHKLSAQNISAVGLADQKPMGNAQNEQAGHLNNRLEIVILTKEDEN